LVSVKNFLFKHPDACQAISLFSSPQFYVPLQLLLRVQRYYYFLFVITFNFFNET